MKLEDLKIKYDKLQKKYGAPVENGRFNIGKSIEDIKWIIDNEIIKEKET